VPSLNIPITAEDRTKSAFNSVLRSTDKLNKSFGGLTKTLGLLAGVGGLGALTTNLLSTADKLGKVSSKLGIATPELQKFQFAAEQSGIHSNTLNTALQRFTRRLEDAKKGVGPAKDAFDDMGLSFSNLDGTTKTAEQMFLEVADAMSGIDDQSKKVSLAFKLFDSEGVSLINMLQNGSGAIKEMGDQLEDFGGIIDDDAIKATERFNDAVNLTSKAVRVVFSESVLFLSDAFERMGRGFDKIFGSAEKVKKVSEDQTAVRIKQTQIENEYVQKLLTEVPVTATLATKLSILNEKQKEINIRRFMTIELLERLERSSKVTLKTNKDLIDSNNLQIKGLTSYIGKLDKANEAIEFAKLDLQALDEEYQKNIASIETFNNRLRLSQETFDDGYNLDVVDLTPVLNNNSMKLSEMTIELSEQEQKFIDIFGTVKDLDKTFEKFGFRASTMSQLKDFAKTFQPLIEGAGAVGDFFARQGEGIMQAGGASGQRAMQVGKEFATKGVEAGIMALVLSNEKVQEALGKVFDALFELIDPIIDLLAPVIESLTEILVELKPLFELFIPVLRETMVPIKGLIHVMKQVIGPIVHLIKEIAKIFTPVGTLVDALNALASPLKSLESAIKSIGGVFGGGGGGGNIVTNTISSIGSALGFADGGRVRGNRSIIVGEEGPEVFTPNQNGTIIPNHDLGGQTVVNVFLDMEGQVKLPLHQYVSSVQRRAERSGNPQLAGILAG
jgi:phage-related protein